MPIAVQRFGRLLAFHIDGFETPDDTRKVEAACASVFAVTGERCFVLSVLSPTAPVPKGEMRAAISALYTNLDRTCAAWHMVITGSGVLGSLQRAFARGTALIASRGLSFRVYSRPDQALAALARAGVDRPTVEHWLSPHTQSAADATPV
jgi:hypothetical protein